MKMLAASTLAERDNGRDTESAIDALAASLHTMKVGTEFTFPDPKANSDLSASL